MGKKIKGKLRQGFSIEIDANKFYSLIETKMREALEEMDEISNPDIELSKIDRDTLVFSGSYDADYSGEYFGATLESPSEDNLERPYISNGSEDITAADFIMSRIPLGLRQLMKVVKIEEKEEDVDYERYAG